MYDSMKVEGNAIRIKFTHVSSGLVARGGELRTFMIAGKDGNFVPATPASITTRCSSPAAMLPSRQPVRYAWDNYPKAAISITEMAFRSTVPHGYVVTGSQLPFFSCRGVSGPGNSRETPPLTHHCVQDHGRFSRYTIQAES